MYSLLKAFTFLAVVGSIAGNRNHGLERMSRAGGSGWNYAGQGNYWLKTHPFCAGKRQSPIDIDTSKVRDTQDSYLQFVDYEGKIAGTMANVGSSLKFTPDGGISSAGVNIDHNNAHYKLLQFHFHWGSTNARGSEHTIDGQEFALELHLVHIKEEYINDTAKALSEPDGLAVVGIMFVVGEGDDSEFAPLNPVVSSAKKMLKDQSAEIGVKVKLNEFLDVVGPSYYCYDGSLTTPTCNEVVSWTVMDKTIAISQKQINAFRGLTYDDGAPMVDNFRPPQPVYNRIVKRVTPYAPPAAGK